MADLSERVRASLAGRYTIERELGRGGVGTVYLARDLQHDRPVARKVLAPQLAARLDREPMVADFGIALAVSSAGRERLTETGLSLGTPAYMSPEQASAEPRLDGRSDQYSLASVLYEMLAGEPPYTGPTAHAIIAKRLTEPIPPLGTRRRVSPAVGDPR